MYAYVIIDVGMTRRTSGADLKPATPTARSRTRPRVAFRTLSVLSWALIEYHGGQGVGDTLGYERNPAPPRRDRWLPETTALRRSKTRNPTVSELQRTPWQPQVEVKVVIGSHRPPSDFHKRASTSAGFFPELLDVKLSGQVGRMGA